MSVEPRIGMLIVAVAHVPFAVALQLRTQSRLFRSMSCDVLAAMPHPPRAAWMIPISRPSFLVAFRQWIASTSPEDSPEIVRLKATMVVSMKREKIAGVCGFVVALGLLALGWRPW